MPAYTKYQLTKAYESIALTRPHICTGCGGTQRLSHSHLIPRSRRADLATDPVNIQYHCLSFGNQKGCHEKHEGMEVATLKDFETNFKTIHRLDREYFWLRLQKLDEHWKVRDMNVWKRVRALLIEIDKQEHPHKTLA